MIALRSYLEKIKNSEPINFDQFLKSLPEQYKTSPSQLFQSKLVSKKPKKWIVSCSDNIFTELWDISAQPKDRIEASQLGNSHNSRVSANLLMVYHQAIREKLCPDVIFSSTDNLVMNYLPKKTLLLIENEENFIQFINFSAVVSKLSSYSVSVENTDIALGGGNRASSKLLIDVYAKYDLVLCAFDYDLGGLKIFKNIKKVLGEKVQFIHPKEYQSIEALFRKVPESDSKLNNAIDLANELGFSKLANTFRKTRRFMEQESLLGNINV